MHTSADPGAGDDGLVVRIRGLTKRYGGRTAVDGIDLDVHRGETVALLGPNGAGKTTTLEVLEGYRRADAGQVRVLGTDPAAAGPAWRARLGIVLQSATDAAELTVAETVHHYARYYPAPRDAEAVITDVGLAGKRGARVRSLSGGQRRRLDVALGIIGDPELLFLDEPTTGFDPQARHQFWDLVAGLRSGGTTIVLTTHYLEEAERLADRVAVISDGRLLDVAPPARLGDRETSLTVVSWRDATGPHEHTTSTPTAFVGELAARTGGEVDDLSVRRPTLEDVYLRMIAASTASAASTAREQVPA